MLIKTGSGVICGVVYLDSAACVVSGGTQKEITSQTE